MFPGFPDVLPHPLVSTGVYSCLCKFTLNWERVLGEQEMIKSQYQYQKQFCKQKWDSLREFTRNHTFPKILYDFKYYMTWLLPFSLSAG